MRWKKIILWAAGALLVLIAAGYLFVTSGSFHQFLLSQAISKAEKATGGKMQIADFAFHLTGPTVDFKGVVLHGTEPAGSPPLFQAARIRAGLEVGLLWSGKIHLTQLIVVRPVLHIQVDPEGHSNFPRPASTPSASHPPTLEQLFSLAIHHFELAQGVLVLNDRQIPLSADLRDLTARAEFDSTSNQYQGSLSYQQGAVDYGDWNTAPHALHLQFAASSTSLSVQDLSLSTGSSKLLMQGNLQNYSEPAFTGNYQLHLDLEDLRTILGTRSLPQGNVKSSGTLTYAHVDGRSFVRSLMVAGDFASEELAVDLSDFRSRVREARGRFHLAQGDLEASDAHADLLGGKAEAALKIRDLTGRPDVQVQASFQNISLDAARAALGRYAPRSLPLRGGAAGRLHAAWHGSLKNLQVQSDFDIAATAPTASGPRSHESSVPVQGQVHLQYDAAQSTLALRQTSFRTPHSQVEVNGVLGTHSRLQIAARTGDLHDLEMFGQGVLSRMPQESGKAGDLSRLGLGGSASFQGELEGSFRSPALKGKLTATNLEVDRTRWASLSATVSASPSVFAVQDGVLKGMGDPGQINFGGQVQLTDWAFRKENPIQLKATVSRLPASAVEQLAGRNQRVQGLINANVSLRGTAERPVADGQVNIPKLVAWNQLVGSLNLKLQADGNTLKSKLDLNSTAGAVHGEVAYHIPDRKYEVNLEANKFSLHRIAAVRSAYPGLQGMMDFTLTGSGSVDSPALHLSAKTPQLQFGQETLDNLNLQADLLDRRARFSLTTARSGVAIQGSGTLDLEGDYPIQASLQSGTLDLRPFLARYLSGAPSDLDATAEVRGTLTGPLRQPRQLRGRVEIPTLTLAYQSFQLKNQGPLQADYADGVFALKNAVLSGEGTHLEAHGNIPLSGSAPMDFRASGNVDLHVIQIFDKKMESGGQLKLNLTASGSHSEPHVEGTLEIDNGSLYTEQFPTGVENLNAKLTLQGKRLVVEQLTGNSGGGQVTGSGYVTFLHGLGFDVALNANSVRVRYPEGVRTVLDADLNLTGSTRKANLTGRVLISRLSFTNAIDLGALAGEVSGPSLPELNPGFPSRLNLAVHVESAQELNLASSKLNIQGSVNLRAQGTAAHPILLGRALVRGGEIFFLGQRYTIQRGDVNFNNPSRTQPDVNVLLSTTIDQYDIRVGLMGPIDRLRTNYSSDPPLPPADIINLLAFGKTAEASAAGSGAPSTMGAESLLAKEVTGQVSSQVEKLAGISHLQIDPLLGGAQRSPGARLAIQERVAGNLLLTYATDVRSTQSELIQIEYQATPRFSISVTRDQNGGIATDFRFKKSF